MSKFLIDRKILSLRMTRVVTLDAFRQKSFPSALTPAREGGASALGPHPGAKTVLLLASSLGWLVSAFHKTKKSAPRELRAVTLEWSGGLSTESGGGCSPRDESVRMADFGGSIYSLVASARDFCD